jgi:3-deoxy-D-manno-octulosonic-acid transferase
MKKYPDKKICISTTTVTGQEMAKKIFSEEVATFFFPLDLSGIVKKVINYIDPYMFVLFETEIWPNLIIEMKKRNVPVFLVNGRISDRSFKGYKKIAMFLKPVFRSISLFCMQTEDDAKRIIKIGAPARHVKVTGNVKYDVNTDAEINLPQAFDKIKGKDIFVAGSTHPGEEQIILKTYEKLSLNRPLVLIVAPRHINRTEELINMCKSLSYEYVLFSQINNDNIENKIIIVDTIGHLKELYSIATVVFVGGSLVAKGGHNIIEPAIFSKPIIFGKYMNNFRAMAKNFVEKEAAIQLKNEEELYETVLKLFKEPALAIRMGKKAFLMISQNSGAVDNLIAEIDSYMSSFH